MSEQLCSVLFTTARGIEELCAQELSQQCGAGCAAYAMGAKPKPDGLEGWVGAEVHEPLDLVKLCYQSRTIHRGILVLATGDVQRGEGGLDDIYTLVKSVDLSEWLNPDLAFAIRSNRVGQHAFQSPQIMKVAGQAVIDRIQETKGYRQRVNLNEPDLILRVDVVGTKCIVGIDFVGEDSLHKRGYRVYDHPASLRSTIAVAMLMLSGWQPEQLLVDPLCGGATIPIEAAHWASNVAGGFFRKDNFAFKKLLPFRQTDWASFYGELDAQANWRKDLKLFGSDKFRKHVLGAQKNAQAALVADVVQIEQLDVFNLDERFPIDSIDHIVTNPPYGIRIADPKEIRKVHHHLFGAAQRALKPDGTMTVIAHDIELVQECVDLYGFTATSVMRAWHGDLPVAIFVLKRR